MTQSYPAYQLTCADIDRLKVVAARIFDRKVSPQSRLEIIARSAGFNTFAALKAALTAGPVWLIGDQHREETHIKSAGIDPKLVPFINGISLNEIIAAGLAWPERAEPEWAASKSARERLKALKRDGGTLKDYLQFLYGEIRAGGNGLHAYRSSLTWADLRNMEEEARLRKLCQDTAVIMSTPQNAYDVSTDPATDEPRAMRPGVWRCARVPLSDDVDFFDIPTPDPVPWNDRAALEQLIEEARIIVFDEEDLRSVKAALSAAGIPALPDYRYFVAKPEILYVDQEEDGSFFSIGYYGATNNEKATDNVCDDRDALSDFAFVCLCEIVTVVHSFGREARRLTFGNERQADGLSGGDEPRLTVPV